MRYVITGAGQIGSQLARDLLAAGHEVTVVRRGAEVEDGAELLQGDAGDRSLVQRAVAGPEGTASAIFHCIHTDYDSAAWRRDLPHRELAVMDVAADADIPVIFPESVYAFGYRARDLSEPLTSDDVEPVSPLGKVRADLLAARAAHPARTVSVVAADLVGPTATPGSSVFQLLVFGPAVSSRTAWVLGDPDAARSMTSIPDLTSAMVAAADESDVLAADGDVIVTSPSTEPVPQRTMAQDVARAGGVQPRPVRKIPWWVVRLAGFSSATMRELYGNRYLWDAPAVIRPGVLETRLGITPASWNDVIRDTVGRAASPR
ncbi:NAD-dependent epimerase/dehydratase family protein [Corynebacterium kalidii]